MVGTERTRRGFLRRAGGLGSLVALGSLTGCSDALLADETPTATATPTPPDFLNRVPNAASTVVHFDVAGLVGADELHSAIEAQRDPAALPDGMPLAVEDSLDALADGFGHDPRALDELLWYDLTGDTAGGGGIVTGDWNPDAVAETVDRYAGVPLPISHESELEIFTETMDTRTLSDGAVAIGEPSVLEPTVAVDAGDAPAVDGRVARAVTASREGLVRAGFTIPDGGAPHWLAAVLPESLLSAIDAGSAAIYRANGDVAAQLRLAAPDTAAAKDAASALSGLGALLSTDADTSLLFRRLAAFASGLSVSRDGTEVVARHPSGGVLLLDALLYALVYAFVTPVST